MFGDTTKPHPSTPFLTGARVYLRPLEKDDLPVLRTWNNDAEIRALTGEVTPLSTVGAEQYFERLASDPGRIWFAVVLRENDRIIGEAGLLRIFSPWRTADLSIIIGDKFCWGKGYGRETILLLMDYAFGALALHRLAIGVVGFNERALKFYEKMGFKREGIQRDGYFHNHQFSDFVMLSILEEEFRAQHRTH